MSSIPLIVVALTTFVFGRFVVDQAGLGSEMFVLAPTLQVIAHAVLVWSKDTSPLVPLLIVGFGYSGTVSVCWPTLPLLVPQGVLGAAFGLMACIQNIGLSLFPLLVAAIYNWASHEYLPWVEAFLMGSSVLAVLVGLALLLLRRKKLTNGVGVSSRDLWHDRSERISTDNV